MKFSFAASIVALSSTIDITYAQCTPEQLEYSEDIGMKVEKVGSVPTALNDAFSYNMAVADTFQKSGKLFFMDQKMGIIYSYSDDEVTKVFDIAENDFPPGLDFNFGAVPSFENKIHNMVAGANDDEIIVVLTSQTLPTGWSEADAPLPAPGAYSGYFCDRPGSGQVPSFVSDIYRIGTLDSCVNNYGGVPTISIYDVFIKFTFNEAGQLANPEPFFVVGNQMSPGHLGGGAVSLEGGKILWAVGDCTIFGYDGRYPPQTDHETCGKILLIDPMEVGSFEIVAKGVRNSQQMAVQEAPMEITSKRKLKAKGVKGKKKGGKTSKSQGTLIFMDIGGVTAEEVNAVPLGDILDTSSIENFGWGRNQEDGKAREGTFYIAPGSGGVLGGAPACEASAPTPEEGFIQPWIQFGRTETDYYYAISSFVTSDESFDKLKLVWSEFNTGAVLGTTETLDSDNYSGPTKAYKINLYDADMTPLPMGFNDLVKEELGEVGYYRGDPRLFHYPDGTAGVFIERTGAFYKLTEIEI